jgi:predicted aspartyl protease
MNLVYTYEYDTTYRPPAPMAELMIGPALSEPALELIALVDSGADATSVPLRHLETIDARRSRKAWMRGMTGSSVLVDLYVVAIRLGPYQQGVVEVVADTLHEEAIIGRDILNHLSVTLNGPAHTVLLA